jgi:hypothetical protein
MTTLKELFTEVLQIIISKIDILCKHILRFVCKSLHQKIHSICKSNFIKFNFIDKHHCRENVVIRAAEYGSTSLFEWTISIFNPKVLSSSLSLTLPIQLPWSSSSTLSSSSSLFLLSCPIVSVAAECGNLELIKHLKATGYILNSTAASWAAAGGHLNVLKYLIENGCSWDKNTCISAAFNGHFELLKWAIENGCSWDADICIAASFGGHLNIIKWPLENRCFWNDYIFEAAATAGRASAARSASFGNFRMGYKQRTPFG